MHIDQLDRPVEVARAATPLRRIVRAAAPGLLVAVMWTATSAYGQPLFQGSYACPAQSPTGLQVAQPLLTNLVGPLNSAISANSARIDPFPGPAGQTVEFDHIDIGGCGKNDGDTYCGVRLASCTDMYANIKLHTLTGLKPVRVSSLAPVSPVNLKNVAAHTNRGPDASLITDGVFAPEGHSSTDPAYALVLPHNGSNGAIVIDLGSAMTLCGTGTSANGACNLPKLQADNDDVYQLEYSSDGTHWLTFGTFPTVGSSGLRTRTLPKTSNFSARYLRVYASSGGNTFAVSELQVWNTNNPSTLVSAGQPTVASRPYQVMDGILAPEGHSSTDPTYAVVLVHDTTPAAAVAVDLGQVVTICGSTYEACAHEPTIQADNDDTYQFDFSVDGKNWSPYGSEDAEGNFHAAQFGPVDSGESGLRKRDMSCSARPDLTTACSASNHGPDFSARYVRVYAVKGGATFAVSELVLYDTSDNQIAPVGPTPLKYAPQAWGPEPFFINGEFAPEGTAWNSAVYATLLADCKATNTCSTTAPATVSSILNVDLTAPFQIDHMVIQADGNDTYQIDGLDEATSTWVSLWSVQPASGSGLRTQTSPTLDPSKTPMVRLLRVYVTAGDGQYSVSELQVLTAQANTAGSYGADADGAEKFACSYDGTVKQTIGIDNGNQILNFTTLPMSFDLDFAEIKITCDAGGFIGTFTDTVQSATNRSCTAGLLAAAAPSSIVNYFQAGYCPAGTTVSASTKGVLSYAQINDIDYVDDSGGMNCGMQDLDQGIQTLLESFIPGLAADLTNGLISSILDYRKAPKSLVPFPPDQASPPRIVACHTDDAEPPPPGPAPDNANGLSGRATKVGSGRDSATLRIEGTFTAGAPIALDQATLTVNSLLREVGIGDLVQSGSEPAVPAGLAPQNGSKPDKGMYKTPPGTFPIISARITPAKGRNGKSGAMDFEIDVERATIETPTACLRGAKTALLETSFLIVGGGPDSASIHAKVPWRCQGAQLLTP